MTNTELIVVWIEIFREFFKFMLPLFGLFGGVNLILNWLWAITIKPFSHS